MLLLCGLVGCGRRDGLIRQGVPPTRQEIWSAIQAHAQRYQMEPAFIYALVAAESNFDASAQSGEARGLMQLKPAAWRVVSAIPYETAVWDWRQNLEVGIDYLAYTRSYLHRKTTFPIRGSWRPFTTESTISKRVVSTCVGSRCRTTRSIANSGAGTCPRWRLLANVVRGVRFSMVRRANQVLVRSRRPGPPSD